MNPDLQHAARKRYFDPHLKCWTVKILPGEYAVVESDEMIVTTLGSCISACIRDVKLGIGGMNHFMLPASKGGEWAGVSSATRFGNFAMEYLINEILKRGGTRQTLEAKLFGGADFSGNAPGTGMQVGHHNARFAHDYLAMENVNVTSEDLGGAYARKVYYHPRSGRVTQKKLTVMKNDTVTQRENAYRATLNNDPIESEIELF